MRGLLKWGGIGCGGLLVLFVVLAIVSGGGTGGAQRATATAAAASAPPAPVATPTTAVAVKVVDAKPPEAAATATPLPPPTKPAAPTKPAGTATPAPLPLAAVGQRVASGGIALTVNGVRKTPELDKVFGQAKEGRVYLVADVTIENVERETAPYNPLYFKVKDADGFEYNPEILTSNQQSLKSGELARGDRARGFVAFQVPASAKGFVVSYQPVVLFGGYQTIRVAVGD
jgi:hypothetical protein